MMRRRTRRRMFNVGQVLVLNILHASSASKDWRSSSLMSVDPLRAVVASKISCALLLPAPWQQGH